MSNLTVDNNKTHFAFYLYKAPVSLIITFIGLHVFVTFEKFHFTERAIFQ